MFSFIKNIKSAYPHNKVCLVRFLEFYKGCWFFLLFVNGFFSVFCALRHGGKDGFNTLFCICGECSRGNNYRSVCKVMFSAIFYKIVMLNRSYNLFLPPKRPPCRLITVEHLKKKL